MHAVRCPDCSQPVAASNIAPDKQLRCPHCGNAFAVSPNVAPPSAVKIAMPPGVGPPRSSKSKVSPFLVIFLLLLASCGAFAIIGVVVGPKPGTGTTATDRPLYISDSEARRLSEYLVELALKHPDDAEWPWTPAEVKRTDDKIMVSGTVQAKNSFGALLTTRWSVTLVPTSGEWAPKSVRLDGQEVYAN